MAKEERVGYVWFGNREEGFTTIGTLFPARYENKFGLEFSVKSDNPSAGWLRASVIGFGDKDENKKVNISKQYLKLSLTPGYEIVYTGKGLVDGGGSNKPDATDEIADEDLPF